MRIRSSAAAGIPEDALGEGMWLNSSNCTVTVHSSLKRLPFEA